MKKTLLACLALVLAAWSAPVPVGLAGDEIKIGVVAGEDRPEFQADQEGFEKALADGGFGPEKIVYDRWNARGDSSLARKIVQKFKADRVGLVHALGAPAARAAVEVIQTIPLVYSSVTDPVAEGLVVTMGAGGGNVTGVSDAWDIQGQLALYSQMLPGARKWGTIYHAGDNHSLKVVARTREAAKKLGLEMVEVAVATPGEVMAAALSLAGRVDAVYITADQMVVSALALVAKACNEKRLPLFAGEADSVLRGAIAALCFDHFQVGYTAGRKAVLILTGEKKPGEIPSGLAENPKLHLNLQAAEAQGVIVDQRFIDLAEKVIK
ncbi:MAG: ABC transporter substrate-binding protein [Thermodesulfobacteriota bacterium]